METSHEWCLKGGSVFGLIPFNIFISDKNDGIKSNVSKFTHDTKLTGAVDVIEGMDDIQRNRLENRVHVNQNRLNKAKCKVS